MKQEVRQYIRKLDNLFLTAESIDDDPELQGHFAKYLCIRTSGLIEVYIKTQIDDYVESTSPKALQKYVNQKFKSFTNIDNDKLSKMLESFSSEWRLKYEEEASDEIVSALNSVVGNRNNIAHGHSDSISLSNMQKYYSKIKELITILDKIIKH